MTRLILFAVLLNLVAGCGPRYAGGSSGSYANADRETTTEVVTQRDPNGRLLFVIAWTAKHGGGSSEHSQQNLLTKIHGRPVHPNLNQRGVYALQRDVSLRQIPLSDEQVSALLQEMEADDFHTSHSETWQKLIVPHLYRVEETNGR